MSSATTRFANKKAMPPVMPGSTPRIGEAQVASLFIARPIVTNQGFEQFSA
jgi:hypothetical protein